MDPAQTCILLNTASGKRGTTGAPQVVRDWAQARGIALRQGAGAELPALAEQAATEGLRTLIAAGGDGTIAAVAQAASNHGLELGVLPLGTFNYFARAHGIPPDLPQALEALESSAPQPRPVAEVNGALFLNNASLGLYPDILRERESIYRRWGRSRIAAYWSVVRTVAGFRRGRRLRVTVDGRPFRVKTPMVFVAISAFQLDRFGLSGSDRVEAGEMAVFVAPDTGRWGLLAYALRLLLGGLREGRDFALLAGREVQIAPADGLPRPMRVARDGERGWMDPPIRFRIRPEPLRLLVPR